MSNDKMREEFEAAISAKAGEPILSIYLSRRGDTYSTSTLHFAWWAWQASREALVIELPPEPAIPEDPEEAIDDSHMDAYHAAKRMRAECVKSVKAAGVKVNS